MIASLLFAYVLSAGCPYRGTDVANTADKARADMTAPRAHLRDNTPQAIRTLLNEHLLDGAVAYPQGVAQPCANFTVEELDAVQASLDACSAGTGPVTSRLGRSDLRTKVARLDPAVQKAALASEHEGTHQSLLVGKCHVIAMQWVHHTTADSRAKLATHHPKLPLLPIAGHEDHDATLRKREGRTGAAVADWLAESVTCAIGHEAMPEKDDGSWTKADLPTWPFEVTYNASGYGPYPFWMLGGGSGGPLTGAGADITTYYSAPLNAERLDHSSCTYGPTGLPDGPCTHLFLNNSYAYLFKEDHSWCCMSSWPAEVCHLTRPQRNFMDVMSFDGVIQNYVSEDGLYTGTGEKGAPHAPRSIINVLEDADGGDCETSYQDPVEMVACYFIFMLTCAHY